MGVTPGVPVPGVPVPGVPVPGVPVPGVPEGLQSMYPPHTHDALPTATLPVPVDVLEPPSSLCGLQSLDGLFGVNSHVYLWGTWAFLPFIAVIETVYLPFLQGGKFSEPHCADKLTVLESSAPIAKVIADFITSTSIDISVLMLTFKDSVKDTCKSSTHNIVGGSESGHPMQFSQTISSPRMTVGVPAAVILAGPSNLVHT